MTKLDSFPPRPMQAAVAPSTTIYRDTPLTTSRPLAVRPLPSSVRALALPDERVSDGVLFGLAALLLPTVAYSLAQALNLVSSGSLERAVQAFLP